MVAVNYNFPIEKGSDFQINFVYNNSSGDPINLSNKCVEFGILGDDGSIRKYSSQALANYDVDGWSITGDNLGTIVIKFSADHTKSFNFLTAVYDLDVKNVGTIKLNNVRLSQGSINLIDRNLTIDPNCAISLDPLVVQTTNLPTTTGSNIPTPTPTVTEETDFCLPYDCGPLDLFSVVYNGSGLTINDLSTTSGSVNVTNTGIISNIELAINKLNHSNVTDLVLLLSPPSGDKILLSANHKIPNYSNNFSFMFSNKADSNKYLHNISNGQTCRIYDKTSIVNYNNESLNSNFDHLFNSSVTGVWNLIIKDTDPTSSGNIDSWKLVITYDSNI
jgi:subtilisin-like proprotein convertase family protein